MTYSDIETDTIQLGPHEAWIQYGKGSGGIAGKIARPELIVKFPSDGEYVIVHAEVGNAEDAGVVLGVVSSIERIAESRPSNGR